MAGDCARACSPRPVHVADHDWPERGDAPGRRCRQGSCSATAAGADARRSCVGRGQQHRLAADLLDHRVLDARLPDRDAAAPVDDSQRSHRLAAGLPEARLRRRVRPPAPSDALRPLARRTRARCTHAFGGVADARLPRCRRSVRPTRGDDGVVPSPSPLVSAPSTSTTTSVCMFYPPGTCCPLAEALLPVQLYCVVRCLRAAQLTTSGAWVAPRLVGSEIFECADSVVPDGRVDRGELPALAECMRVRPDVAALVTC